MPKISIIIALYNEAENIPELYRRLTTTLKKDFPHFTYELIFVDDGSTDDTFSILEKYHHQNQNLKIIQFSRNFGHHIALAAGIDLADSDYTVVMDADLQDQPEEIIKLFHKLEQGYDLVYGIRKNRQDNLWKKISATLFWRFIRYASDLSIAENQSMLRIFNRSVLLALKQIKESHRFYAGIFSWVGFKQSYEFIEHGKRSHGQSKYSLKKMISLMFNATVGFTNKPLYLISYLGIIISITAILFAFYLIYRKLTLNIAFVGWTSLMVTILFIGGLIIFSIGILGIYLSRLYQQSLNRPLYLIRKKLL